ncbi:hypothetical protein [Sulfurimonas autotrophica]|uniref:Uncharacterized protein n=1 Tax=Sulfurimonas autotrophica (strain ATCC BAA-671 / DSM 16294 / JCM 11897 / OK10) TaxID=563040 RepID=E0URE8_SULAO|nr:hypothetical protein [Sulfurimonas autotrophica]ADN10034.1 conserved hypothetical protein [Sulfurimonas autotrophica DSM 16294]
MKNFFLTLTLLTLIIQNLVAQDAKVKYQNVSQKQMQEQNLEIATLAAKEMSKGLPKKIDKYTTLRNIQNEGPTLVYTFVINSGAKSDEAIRKEDHSRMQKAVTQGICQSSERFLKAGVNISYIYMSVKTNKLLFRFDITKDKCNYLAPR